MAYYIYAKQKGSREVMHPVGNGTIELLKIYARQFPDERVDEAVQKLSEDNPTFQFEKRKVPINEVIL